MHHHGAMDEQLWAGVWWIPGETGEHTGILRLQRDGSTSLELVGGFDPMDTFQSETGTEIVGSRLFPLIHGIAEGKKITLLGSIPVMSRGGFMSPRFQRVQPNQALVGVHLESREETVFESAYLWVENMTAWMQQPNLIRPFEYPSTDIYAAQLAKTEPQSITVDGWTYVVEMVRRDFRHSQTRGGEALEGGVEAVIHVTAPEPAGLQAFNSVTLEFMDFLTLASGEASGLYKAEYVLAERETWTDPRVDPPVENERSTYVENYGRRVFSARPDEKAPDLHYYRFTARDLSFVEAYPAWLRIRRQASDACNVYFGLDYSPPGFTETRLFSVATVVESLHASLFGDAGAPHDSTTVQELRNKVKAALADEDADLRDLALRGLKPGPTYAERARYLASRPASEALALLIPDISTWAKRLTRARNGLAHEAGKGITEDAFELEWDSRAVVALALMAELGLGDGVQLKAAQDSLARPR